MADSTTVRIRFDVILPAGVFHDISYLGIASHAELLKGMKEIFAQHGLEVSSFEFDGGWGSLADDEADFQRVTAVTFSNAREPP